MKKFIYKVETRDVHTYSINQYHWVAKENRYAMFSTGVAICWRKNVAVRICKWMNDTAPEMKVKS
jgi:hypothetical protein